MVFPPNFVHEFSRKIFFMLYSVNWPNFTAWFSLLLEILVNMCIVVVCKLGYDVINFEIKLANQAVFPEQKVKTKIWLRWE